MESSAVLGKSCLSALLTPGLNFSHLAHIAKTVAVSDRSELEEILSQQHPVIAVRAAENNLDIVDEGLLRKIVRHLHEPPGDPPDMDYPRSVILGILRIKAGGGSSVALRELGAFAAESGRGAIRDIARARYVEVVRPRLRRSLVASGVLAAASAAGGVVLSASVGVAGALLAGVFLFGGLGVFACCLSELRFASQLERGRN